MSKGLKISAKRLLRPASLMSVLWPAKRSLKVLLIMEYAKAGEFDEPTPWVIVNKIALAL